ncbi:DNA cytosine methyltransferase [Clavibacter michiganensis]|uniref:DNA cytosine methyltransferase n=1 Tax=Clavibacter michiganensis TaxID=28447 RepID=UPI003EBC3D77
MAALRVVEICAGAGGQALGLHRAGFEHALSVEIDATAAETLRHNIVGKVSVGDVADPAVWRPSDYAGVDLLAGGVPCPPFSIAGKQLGSSDERDLFAWAVEQTAIMRPRALLLENVRGLAAPRFSAYRQRILDRLRELGYVADWRLLFAADFGVAQLRPRFVLVALKDEDARYFSWPEPNHNRITVGEALAGLMGANGWPYVEAWRKAADGIGPTLVGGSKKHGGADLGPTRAKAAWAALGVDGRGVADMAPSAEAPSFTEALPKLTIDMVARLQGWREEDEWQFAGRKTSQYRQIGNAFPPPMAEAVGRSISNALRHVGDAHELPQLSAVTHDPVYKALVEANGYLTLESIAKEAKVANAASVERHLSVLARDFELMTVESDEGPQYALGGFKGFIGQAEHRRHEFLRSQRSRIS